MIRERRSTCQGTLDAMTPPDVPAPAQHPSLSGTAPIDVFIVF
jgi:hypothetical protein